MKDIEAMKIKAILATGEKTTINDEETLQLMITTKKIHSFKRSDGWVVIGRDKIRKKFRPYKGQNRRKTGFFSQVCWHCF